MKILFSVHLYPPYHNAGGEMFLHNMAKFLISQGHQCRVLLHEAAIYGIKKVYCHEGVDVFPRGRNLEEHFFWADRVVTHLGFTSWTIPIAHIFHKPVYFVVHNTHRYSCVEDASRPVGIIYNCAYARDLLQYPQRSIILHPPVDWRKYDQGMEPFDNEYITLINLNKNKGGEILYQIARAMPERRFLGVQGGYDPQILEELPNVRLMDHTPDIGAVYRMTRILIMPSEYESWGMTATEAMSNGIPVICTPTFGLKENCGDAAAYVGNPPTIDPLKPESISWPRVTGRDNIEAWVKEIRKLDNKKHYLSRSKRARERSRELDPAAEYAELLNFLQ